MAQNQDPQVQSQEPEIILNEIILNQKEQEVINLLKKYNIDFEEKGSILMIKGEIEYIHIMTVDEILKEMNKKKEDDGEYVDWHPTSNLIERICIVQGEDMHICFDVDREGSGIVICGPRGAEGVPIVDGVSIPLYIPVLYDRPYLKIFFVP